MDIIYGSGEATVTDVLSGMHDPPSQTAVRTLLGILQRKGYVEQCGKRSREKLYRAVRPRQNAGRFAMRRVIKTFFEGSLRNAVGAHLADPASEVSAEELEWLSDLIRRARKKGE